MSVETLDFEALQARVAGTNISEQTLLATDYLNHFNEVVMVLEMIPDFPEGLEEVQSWRPKSYSDHFRDSSFSEKELAVEAYDYVPANFRRAFETTIEQINQTITAAIARLERLIEEEKTEELRLAATDASRNIQRLLDVASAIIHGTEITMAQTEIDDLLAD